MKSDLKANSGTANSKPGNYPDAEVTQPWEAAAHWASMVRSNIHADAEGMPAWVLDLTAIEREARAAQAAWIAKMLKTYFAGLVRKLSGGETPKRDERVQRSRVEAAAGSAGKGGARVRAASDAARLPHPVAHTY